MLGQKNAVANIAVKDLGVARRFYENTLGLTVASSECEGLLAFRSGTTTLNVYQSSYAGTNRATAVTWSVGDEIDSVVEALKAKGVRFEHYDLPGLARQGDLHVSGPMKMAWFKDPDGNILHLVT